MRFLQFAVGDFGGSKELVGMEDAPYVEFLKSKFSLNEDMAIAIAYALSYCQSPTGTSTRYSSNHHSFKALDPTLPALQRLHRYLLSAGRYGPSPFLLGHYGSSGEISQGFCRTSAVSGGVYILGKTLKSVKRAEKPQSGTDTNTPEYIIHFEEWPDALTCKVMISSATRIPRELLPESKHAQLRQDACSTTVARCVAIIDKPPSFVPTGETRQSETMETEADNDEETSSSDRIDAGVLIFPPNSLSTGSASSTVDVLIAKEQCPLLKENMRPSTERPIPSGILYLSTLNPENVPPKDLLQPYLDTTLSLTSAPTETVSPLFTSFYNQRSPAPSDASTPLDASHQSFKFTDLPNYILVPQLPTLPLTEPPDIAAVHAETVFWDTLRILRPQSNSSEENVPSFWPPLPDDDEDDED
ncbi:hypothetical protein MPER_07919 [Moniliophthora perniciosa FA553]|nr:hypothetical protein MPER_07919 [Moniliophthora perniciosa FA553]